MISIMELMEKKTPSIKNNDRKKGMTLVEVMAAMAILSIIFVGISGLISSIIKSETKSNALLESSSIAKSILSIFEVNGSSNQCISNDKFNAFIDKETEYKFNTTNNVIKQIISNKPSDGEKYTLKIKVQNTNGKLYKVIVEVYDSITKNTQIKYMYIYR